MEERMEQACKWVMVQFYKGVIQMGLMLCRLGTTTWGIELEREEIERLETRGKCLEKCTNASSFFTSTAEGTCVISSSKLVYFSANVEKG